MSTDFDEIAYGRADTHADGDVQATADIVARLNDQEADVAALALQALPEAEAVEALDQPEFDTASDVLALLPRDRAARLITEMSADRATAVLRELDPDEREAILGWIAPEIQASLRSLLTYTPDTAGGMMTTEYVWVPDTATVADTLSHIKSVERTRETIYSIYVLDAAKHTLKAAVPLRRLISAEPGDKVIDLARRHKPISVAPEEARAAVALTISRNDLLAVPVIDRAKRMLGIVTVDDVIDAIIAEGSEDLQKFGGVGATRESFLEIGLFDMFKKRAGWLCILFVSEMLTATAMQHFQDELSKAMVLTIFIPLIMSSGGNSGSQATSLLIRALALGQLRLRDWWRVALRELPTGLALGATLGVLGALRVAAWQLLGFYDYGEYWPLIALTIFVGLIGVVTFGSLTGSMLPFVLQRAGFDPASASAPFVATLVDVTGLVIYFLVAFAILQGTLL